MLGIATGSKNEAIVPSIILLQPSNDAFQSMLSSLPTGGYREDGVLEKIPLLSDMPEDQVHVLARTSDLRFEDRDFSSKEFLEETSYVQFSDSTILGPEYDIPRSSISSAIPKDEQPKKAWKDVYERYREKRMDICGLDLEPVPEP